MRSFVAAGIAALILAAGAVGYGIFVENTAEDFADGAREIRAAVEREDFAAARESVYELGGLVERKSSVLGAIADHGDIHDLKRELAQLEVYLAEEEKTDSLASCAGVESYIARLSGNSRPSIFNIL